MTMRKNNAYSIRKIIKIPKNLHRQIKEHRKEGGFCSTIHEYQQKRGFALRSLHSDSQNNSIKGVLYAVHRIQQRKLPDIKSGI